MDKDIKHDDEFNKLYKFLTDLVEQKKPKIATNIIVHSDINKNIDETPQLSCILVDSKSDEESEENKNNKESEIIKKMMNRDSSQPLKCNACEKFFTTTISLRRHHMTSEICKKWFKLPKRIRAINSQEPIHEFIENILNKSTIHSDNPKQCKFCENTFSTKGNLVKHFVSSVVCNRLAFYDLIKNIRNDMD